MPQEVLHLGVLAMRRPPVTRWGQAQLRPSAVLPQVPALAPRTLITDESGTETWYLGAAEMVLFSGDTSHHMDNLNSGRPSVWVALRGQDPATAELACITVDPYEGEGFAGDDDATVEAVPMPAAIRDALAAFVARHHVDIPFKKRKRQPSDPNALQARAPRILPPEQKWHKPEGQT
ncbi:MAG: Protein of unknown function (DUF3305) [Rhodobacteraceae bacterium HLUCCA12]|nr:MAG: Protein of unknown function (DUF3305) [Rhodobacteraceae bacterium HLUCCA12]